MKTSTTDLERYGPEDSNYLPDATPDQDESSSSDRTKPSTSSELKDLSTGVRQNAPEYGIAAAKAPLSLRSSLQDHDSTLRLRTSSRSGEGSTRASISPSAN